MNHTNLNENDLKNLEDYKIEYFKRHVDENIADKIQNLKGLK